MWLCNVHNAANNNIINIEVKNGRICTISDNITVANETVINFENATIIPGLINSHDHLDFNIYPQLGNRIYDNYTQWGNDIHAQNKTIIEAVLKVPENLRAEWGLYKNLIAGVTTVVNHGKKLNLYNAPVTVYQKPVSLHSVAFEKRWKAKLLNPLTANNKLVMHAGEGTDNMAANEIDLLNKWNWWHKKIVAVHGVSMNNEQAKKIEALVWCPNSNFFLLNKTASVSKLNTFTKILFGTDSTLTAHWNFWEHLRLALQTGEADYTALWKTVTTTAADVWQLNKGLIAADKDADLIVIKGSDKKISDGTVYATNPDDILLVMHRGAIKLIDDSIVQREPGILNLKAYSSININNKKKWVVGNLPYLIKQILNYYPDAKFPVTVD